MMLRTKIARSCAGVLANQCRNSYGKHVDEGSSPVRFVKNITRFDNAVTERTTSPAAAGIQSQNVVIALALGRTGSA